MRTTHGTAESARRDAGAGSGAVLPEPLSQPDPIGSWLDVLTRLLRTTPSEARSIRDELDSHLRDRVRDIMLTGMDEVRATRDAIAELGDAADLASRYERASRNPTRRRFAMNIGLLGVAGAALVTSMVALQQPGGAAGPEARAYKAPETALPEGATRSIGRFHVEDTQAHEVIEQAAAAAGLRASISSKAMESIGSAPNGSVTMSMDDATLQRALEEVWTQLSIGPEGDRLAYRVRDGVLRVTTAHELDMVERVLVTIDISGPQERGVADEQICELVQTFIEPDAWVDNGGDLGEMSVVGDKMFVRAPPRMIEGVRWIVGELSNDKQASGPGADSAWRRRGVPLEDQGEPRRIVIQAEDGRLVARVPGPDGEQRFIADQLEFVASDGTTVSGVQILSDIPNVGRFFTGGTDMRGVAVEGVPLDRVPVEGVPLDAAPSVEPGDEAPPADGGESAAAVVRVYVLANTAATEMASVVGDALNVAPTLRQSPVTRSVGVDASQNSLILRATDSELDRVERLVRELDGGPAADRAVTRTRKIQLRNARAADVRAFLGSALDINPALKECLVDRVFEVDASDNTLTVSATPGQVDVIGRIVEVLDG